MESIKKFEDFIPIDMNNSREYQITGDNLKPSGIHSRRGQEFYDRYTKVKIMGKSKYDLSSETFKLASRTDELGLLAQFCLQLERESIMSDVRLKQEMMEYLKNEIDKYIDAKLNSSEADKTESDEIDQNIN